MKKVICLVALVAAVLPATAGINVDRCIGAHNELNGAYVGVCAYTPDGDTLAFHNAGALFVPASNMKLLTTASALEYLGDGYRYPTVLAVSGKIEDGVLDGDVFIRGGGDPTLAYPDSPDTVFAFWMEMLRSRGISEIRGRVIGDGESFGGMNENPHWEIADAGTYYGTGVTGLQFAGNILNFNVQAGACPGDSLKIKQAYPDTPWMNFIYDCTTGSEGTGDRLYLYTVEYSDNAVLRGTFAAGQRQRTVRCSNKNPEMTCAREFARYLLARGINVGGFSTGRTPEEAVEIGVTLSCPLRDILVPLMRESDNFLAETVFRTLGKERFGDSGYESSIRAERMILDSLGFAPVAAPVITDGSGLSSTNLVSPEYICRLLGYMLQNDGTGTFLECLPTAGENGTVADFLTNLPESARKSVHLKSGTMSGVKCYSGYYLPGNSSPVIFSVMINHANASSYRLSKAAADIITSIISGR
ncbi:MAG: D-alanyl-D-alanine carboxypeptidase/D-alanyl-D-alanine-endopeptidase [Bacteroidales bacterium]|nr:D-alanyl-D-alanine carboxypeptidase/D-alanyl-D-alanine-endopeptidase [Bacteroidales bacterium]